MKGISLIIIFAFLCLFPVIADAALVTDMWVSGLSGSETQLVMQNEQPVDTVHWWKNSKHNYHLFLPSTADLSDLRLAFEGAEKLVVKDGTVLENDVTMKSLPVGEKIELRNGGQAFSLTLWRGGEIPTMYMTTESNSLKKIHESKDNRETGQLWMVAPDGTTEYEGALSQIRGRGNSTFIFAKKPYQIKLEKSAPLCGMDSSTTWVLLADYRDCSLVRNKMTLDMATAMEMPYVPENRHVNVYINGQYLGVYLLCEKVEVGDGRVMIDDLEKETEAINDVPLMEYESFGSKNAIVSTVKGKRIPIDPGNITGGYLLEMEYQYRYDDEVSGIVTQRGQPLVIKSPEIASEKQAAYVATIAQRFEDAIFSGDGRDPVSGKHFSELTDIVSLVNEYILEELAKNYDGNDSSQYIFKHRNDDKLYFGIPWDYDSAYGSYSDNAKSKWLKPTGLGIATENARSYYWLPALYKHASFRKLVKESFEHEWLPMLDAVLGYGVDNDLAVLNLDTYATWLAPDALMNFVRWPIPTSRVINTGRDYASNIVYLKSFIVRRVDFLCQEWGIIRTSHAHK